MAEILLKVVLNTITLTLCSIYFNQVISLYIQFYRPFKKMNSFVYKFSQTSNTSTCIRYNHRPSLSLARIEKYKIPSHASHNYISLPFCIWFLVWLDWFMLFNATFNNILAISQQSALLVEETGVPGETTDLSQVTENFYRIMLYRLVFENKLHSIIQLCFAYYI